MNPQILSWKELKEVNLGLAQFSSSSIVEMNRRKPLKVLSWKQLGEINLNTARFSKKEVSFII
jgi:hypothetical protein